MTDEEKKDFLSGIDSLIAVFRENGPVSLDSSVDIEKVKLIVAKMAEISICDESERKNFLEWMDSHEFWTSPASVRYHANFKGGLALHSLMVTYQALLFSRTFFEDFWHSKRADQYNFSAGDVFVASISHDFCKAASYTIEYRNTKNVQGNWVYTPHYKVKTELRNLGHGNESVLNLIESMPSYIKKRPVLEAISRHMGFSDLSEYESYNYSNFLQNPLVILIQTADQTAANWFDC